MEVFKVLVFVLLVVLFALQVKDSLNKFFSRKTSISTTMTAPKNGLKLPTISFCPSYKNIHLRPKTGLEVGGDNIFRRINSSVLENGRHRCILSLLIHEANPQSLPIVFIVFANDRPSVPNGHFSKYSKTKQISSKNNVHYWRDWVWPSGSLMTPVL